MSAVSMANAISAQESFQHRYDDNPLDAIYSYTQQMHMHTQRQLELARRAARRRGLESKTASTQRGDPGPTLTSQESVDSNQSRGSL